MSLLQVRNLCIEIRNEDDRYIELVSDLSLDIEPGTTLGLVGESGCGKSLTAMSIVGLLAKPQARIASGTVHFAEQDITALSAAELGRIRGNKIAIIFQDPMTALNPVHAIGKQIAEAIGLYFPQTSKVERREKTLQLLSDVGIPQPAERLRSYPHQLSGGMRQRVMIAMALAGEPELLIADEPTTALDVTIQAQISALLKSLQKKKGMAMLFISHDLGLVSQLSDRIAVMYAGQIIEECASEQLFRQARHPYSKALLAALPRAELAPKSMLYALEGQVPGADNMPVGCRFANRCAHAQNNCLAAPPELEKLDNASRVACYHWGAIQA